MTKEELKLYNKHFFKNRYDLKSGMICELRDNSLAIFIYEEDKDELKLFGLEDGTYYADLNDYQDNLLIRPCYGKICDIMKIWYDIYDWKNNDVMWERGNE